jgi:chemotaxis protein CheC
VFSGNLLFTSPQGVKGVFMGKFSFDNMNSMYLDVLKELGNIGAGNATTAIASMLNLTIDMKVPHVELKAVEELGSAICPEEETIVGIFLEVQNDISGSMMFLMRLESAHYLVDRLMGNSAPKPLAGMFSEMELSALMEVGNIIAGSYLSALSTMTNLVITPSIPYIAVDMAAAILSVPAIQFGQLGDHALLIETEFGDDVMIEGYFILLPDENSYDKILESLGISL